MGVAIGDYNNDSFDDIFEVISKEYNLTKSLILEITGKNKLLESDRDLKSSVSLRNKTIIPKTRNKSSLH